MSRVSHSFLEHVALYTLSLLHEYNVLGRTVEVGWNTGSWD